MSRLNDKNSKDTSILREVEGINGEDASLAKKLYDDALTVDGSVSKELQQALFLRIAKVERAQDSKNNIVTFPQKRVLMPTAIAASFLAVVTLVHWSSIEPNGAMESIASIESQTDQPNKGVIIQKTSPSISSKYLNKEMVAIKADLNKLKQRIASL